MKKSPAVESKRLREQTSANPPRSCDDDPDARKEMSNVGKRDVDRGALLLDDPDATGNVGGER